MSVTRAGLYQLHAAVERADAAVAQARRDLAAARNPLEVALARARLLAAQGTAAAARAQLDQALDGLFGQLDPAVPLALLPVRLETRFSGSAVGQRDLLIRIYPDDIHSDTHESGLSDVETIFAQHFWEELWRSGREPDRAALPKAWEQWRRRVESAWRQLVQRFGTGRALWVALQMQPANPADQPEAPAAVGAALTAQPLFPAVPSRQGAWGRAAIAGCLPDRFIAVGYRDGTRVFGVWGNVVRETLVIGPDPSESGAPAGDPLQQDWYRWKTDFGAAVDAGMGIRVPAAALGPEERLDLLLVYGVRGSSSPDDSAAELTDLLQGHLYTWGLDVVPQGTPTNNVPEARSGYRRTDPDPAGTLDLLTAAAPTAESDVAHLARALGVDPSLFRAVDHRGTLDQQDASAMNAVAWSAWWAYWCRRLLGDVFGGSDRREQILPGWRRHFLDYVRARGPLPAIRVGNQPYGMLPVSSLDRWDAESRLPDLVVLHADRGQRIGGSVGWNLDPFGTPQGWSETVPAPELDGPPGIRAVAVGTSGISGRPRLMVLQTVARAPDGGVVIQVRVGRELDGHGRVNGGWADPAELPDRAAPEDSFAVAVADSGRGSDLAVFQITPDRAAARARLRIARAVDDAGAPGGGWSDPVDLGLELPSATRALGMSWDKAARGDALVVVATSDPVGGETVAILIGRRLDSNGVASGRWTGPIDVPDLGAGALSAAVLLDGNRFTVLVAGAQLTGAGGGPNGVYARAGTASGSTVTWDPLVAFTVPGDQPIALAAGQVGRGGSLNLTSEAGLVNLLDRLRDSWNEPVDDGTVPSLGRPGVAGPDKIFLDLLTTDATTTGIAVRSLLGPQLASNLWRLMGLAVGRDSLQQYLTSLGAEAGALLQQLGLPPGAWLTSAAFADETTDLSLPLVQEEPVSESDPVAPGYLGWLTETQNGRHRSPDDIHQRRYLADLAIGPENEPLLLKVLRHSLENGYVDAALRQPVSAADQPWQDALLGRLVTTRPDGSAAPNINAIDPELIDLTDFVRDESPPAGGTPTRWGYLGRKHAITQEALGERLRAAGIDAELDELRAGVEHLAGRPSAVLDRLLTESLDLASHRLDAWITSLATRRLAAMRAASATGTHFGAWGFVEHLRPATEPQSTGFVHAPSIGHATTAAVLRSAWLSHGGAQGAVTPFSIDLSSARVRQAAELLDGIRQRQPLGALLGYQLERGLHERHPGQDLDQYIAPLRERFPLVADKLTATATGESAESVAARNVVDGLALVRAEQKAFDPATLPGISAAEAGSIGAEIALLRDTLDAASDLGVAESVYQAVHGRSGGTGAILDALSKGTQPPPQVEVVQTPRTGVALSHRIVVALRAGAADAASYLEDWDPADKAVTGRQVRAAAEPTLNGWVAALLGDPVRVIWRVREKDDQGSVTARTRTLAGLGLSPMDVVSLSSDRPPSSGSDLELLLGLDAVRSRPAGRTVVSTEIRVERDASWEPAYLSLAEFFTAARVVKELLGESRPALGRDLAAVGSRDDLAAAGELHQRAAAAQAALAKARAVLRDLFTVDGNAQTDLENAVTAPDTVTPDLDNLLDLPAHMRLPELSAVSGLLTNGLDPLRHALLALWYFGLAGAMPRSAAGDDDAARATLVRQAQAVDAEAGRRLAAAATLDASASAKTAPTADDYLAVLAEVFGRDFRVLPQFTVPDADSLTQAFTVRKNADDAGPAESLAWFGRVARVRPAAARLEDTFMLTEPAGSKIQLTLDVAQLPVPSSGIDRWMARPLRGTDNASGGRVSLAVHHLMHPGALDVSGPLAGLVIDEWTEVIPSRTETTGITLHYDAPASAPPNAVLLAVHPVPGEPWTVDTLEAVLRETIQCARLRAVDPDTMPGQVGHFLPAACFASNAGDQGRGDTVATDFRAPAP